MRFNIAVLAFCFLFNTTLNAQIKSSFQDTTEVTKLISSKYMDYYLTQNFDSLESYMNDYFVFNDPTANMIFSTKTINTKQLAIENFKIIFNELKDVKVKFEKKFFSANYAIFELRMSFNFRTRNQQIAYIDIPLITVLKIVDAKVVEHLDYADYSTYLIQYNKQIK